jgi:hypothetical protein
LCFKPSADDIIKIGRNIFLWGSVLNIWTGISNIFSLLSSCILIVETTFVMWLENKSNLQFLILWKG